MQFKTVRPWQFRSQKVSTSKLSCSPSFDLSSLLIYIYSFGIMKPKHTWCKQPGMPRVSVSPPVVSGGIQRNHHIWGHKTFAAGIARTPRSLESFIWKHLLSPRPSIRSSPIMDYLAQLPSYLPPLSCLCPETHLDMLHTLMSQREATSRRIRLISKSGVYVSLHDTRSHQAKMLLINDESTSLPVKSSI